MGPRRSPSITLQCVGSEGDNGGKSVCNWCCKSFKCAHRLLPQMWGFVCLFATCFCYVYHTLFLCFSLMLPYFIVLLRLLFTVLYPPKPRKGVHE